MKVAITAIKFLLVMSLITGAIYPIIITAFAQLIFPEKANGSLVYINNQPVGSELIGQKFNSSKYFWSRPSSIEYNPLPSGGSNLGPSSKKLKSLVMERKKFLMNASGISDSTSFPSEMLFASASGLDPHISPEAARIQIDRVASARNFNEYQKNRLKELVNDLIEGPQYLILGQPRINVFMLNLATDTIR